MVSANHVAPATLGSAGDGWKQRWQTALKDSMGPAIDLDSEEEPKHLYAFCPPAEQCDRCGGNHASTLRPHFREEPPQHIDALARSPALPHCSQRDIRRLDRGLWQIDGTLFDVGRASGQDNNCLISTFCQLLQKPLEHAVVRDALRRKCPEHVDAQNFLEVNAVWRVFFKPWVKTRPFSTSFA